jgi:8-oxo-dGTP pyrophosphatase MutT (NUDIX family)
MENTSPAVNFTIKNIQHALTKPLPGVSSQIKMAPMPQKEQVHRWDSHDDCRDAGVLILLYPYTKQDAELYLALIRRREYPGVHSGQISFPGGRREAGETLQSTALRETKEELGVSTDGLKIIGQLSSLYTPPSNFCIYPFVAFNPFRPEFRPEPREVAEVIEVSLTKLVDPAVFKVETWHFEKYGKRRIPFFEIKGHKIWGATAMILSEFLTLLNDAA